MFTFEDCSDANSTSQALTRCTDTALSHLQQLGRNMTSESNTSDVTDFSREVCGVFGELSSCQQRVVDQCEGNSSRAHLKAFFASSLWRLEPFCEGAFDVAEDESVDVLHSIFTGLYGLKE